MSVGAKLKKARNKLGLSIDDIRNKSKIKKNYLIAIENDNFEKLPGEVYTKVYIRGYAKIVGLDPQEILAEYENNKRKNSNEEIKKNNSNNKNTKSKNNKDKKLTKVDKIFKGIIGIILILIIVLLSYNIFFRTDQNQNDTTINDQNSEVVQQEDSNNTNNNEGQNNQNQVENNDSENSNVNNEENTSTTENIDQNEEENNDSEQSQPIVKDTSKEFKIIANDKSWLQVTIDDDLKYQGFINEDEIMTHNGEETVTLKIGNGIAVQVEINGEVLGPFGKRGEVIIKQFDLN